MRPKFLKKDPKRTIVVAGDQGSYEPVFHVLVPTLVYLGAYTDGEKVKEDINKYLRPQLQRDEAKKRFLLGYATQFRVGTLDVISGELSGDYYDVRVWFPSEIARELEDSYEAQRERHRQLLPQPHGVQPFKGFGDWVPRRK